MFRIIILLANVYLAAAGDSPYAHYPAVPKSASINGFADPIFADLPECAKECVKLDTDITPCPYWDTGCFCVMANWSGIVGQCIAENCEGDNVEKVTSLATSLCDRVGAKTWMMPESVSDMLSVARAVAGGAADATTTLPDQQVSTDASASMSSSGPQSTATSIEAKSTDAKNSTAKAPAKAGEKKSLAGAPKMVIVPGLLGLMALLI